MDDTACPQHAPFPKALPMTDLWVCAECGRRYVIPSLARDCEAKHEGGEPRG